MTRLPLILALILLAACAAPITATPTPTPTATPTETPVPAFPTVEGIFPVAVQEHADIRTISDVQNYEMPGDIRSLLVAEADGEMALARRDGTNWAFPIAAGEDGLAVFGDGTWPMENRGNSIIFTDPVTGEVWQQVLTAEVPDGVTGVSGVDNEGELWLLFWNDRGEFMGKLPGLVAPVEGMNPIARATETGQMQILTWPIEGQEGQYALTWNEAINSWHLTPEGAALYEQITTPEMYALVVNPETGRVEKQLQSGYKVIADRQTGANRYEQTETGEWVRYVPRVRYSGLRFAEERLGEVGGWLTAEMIEPPDMSGGTGLTLRGQVLPLGPRPESRVVYSDQSEVIKVYNLVTGAVSFVSEYGRQHAGILTWFPLPNGDVQLMMNAVSRTDSRFELWGYPGGMLDGRARSFSGVTRSDVVRWALAGAMDGQVWGFGIGYSLGSGAATPDAVEGYKIMEAVMNAWLEGRPPENLEDVFQWFPAVGIYADEATVEALVGE